MNYYNLFVLNIMTCFIFAHITEIFISSEYWEVFGIMICIPAYLASALLAYGALMLHL